LVRRRTIDANVVGSGPRLIFAVSESAVVKPGKDGTAALSHGVAISGVVQSHAARPHGRNVELGVKPRRCAWLRSCS
jgi:hypothetical protein